MIRIGRTPGSGARSGQPRMRRTQRAAQLRARRGGLSCSSCLAVGVMTLVALVGWDVAWMARQPGRTVRAYRSPCVFAGGSERELLKLINERELIEV
jgi:hypothetical protein